MAQRRPGPAAERWGRASPSRHSSSCSTSEPGTFGCPVHRPGVTSVVTPTQNVPQTRTSTNVAVLREESTYAPQGPPWASSQILLRGRGARRRRLTATLEPRRQHYLASGCPELCSFAQQLEFLLGRCFDYGRLWPDETTRDRRPDHEESDEDVQPGSEALVECLRARGAHTVRVGERVRRRGGDSTDGRQA